MRRFLFFQRSMLFIFVGFISVALYSNFDAYAEEPLICADDIEKYCKEIRPGDWRILNCLKSHETELTVACKGKIEELKGIIKDAELACSGDISKFCNEVQPGEGRILKCLREHDKELSSSCSAKIEMIGKRFQKKGE